MQDGSRFAIAKRSSTTAIWTACQSCLLEHLAGVPYNAVTDPIKVHQLSDRGAEAAGASDLFFDTGAL